MFVPVKKIFEERFKDIGADIKDIGADKPYRISIQYNGIESNNKTVNEKGRV